MSNNLYKNLPKIDNLLKLDNVVNYLSIYPRGFVINVIRDILDDIRNQINNRTILDINDIDIKIISNLIDKEIERKSLHNIKKVINATGVIIHTNLGRSVLCDAAVKHLNVVSKNYTNLEYDLENKKRGSRNSHIESLICDIVGCESAIVVNNNAAAIMIVLNTLCSNKDVVISRGEIVEIGGSFRIPEIIRLSGAILREVGCTNKTHLYDYENELENENVSAILKVHTSNYKIKGFSKNVSISELNSLKEKYNKILIADLGSGALIDFSKYGLHKEPTVQEALKLGCDIVTFSGDKMLGGPQAGIIVGKKSYIDLLKKNNLFRVLRVDKFTLAALESTLKQYVDIDFAIKNIPTLNMITMEYSHINDKSLKLYNMLKNLDNYCISIADDFSVIGGGSMPDEKLKTRVLKIKHKHIDINKFEEKLRLLDIPIIGCIHKDFLKFDLRTIMEEDFQYIYSVLSDLN